MNGPYPEITNISFLAKLFSKLSSVTEELQKKHIYEQHGLHKNLDQVVMNR
jgi:hypothetical protein